MRFSPWNPLMNDAAGSTSKLVPQTIKQSALEIISCAPLIASLGRFSPYKTTFGLTNPKFFPFALQSGHLGITSFIF